MSNKDPLPLEQRLQVNKRFTLNLLIQGAATHAFLGAHHVAADEFRELNPNILPLYDRTMVSVNLGYWIGSIPLVMGQPVRYFRNLSHKNNPFRHHRFLLRHGQGIAEEARQFVFDKAAEQGLATVGWRNEKAVMDLFMETLSFERPHQAQLEEIGRRVCSKIYGIDIDRLDAELTDTPGFGTVRTPKTWSGRFIKKFMMGWSAVERREENLIVVAKAWNWSLLIHELVKGTVELICLHGLSNLEDEDFDLVMDETEHVEYEIPMLQIGGTFFRKFLAVVPRELALAEAIMHVARMPAVTLDEFLFEMIESPNRATDRLLFLARS